MDPVVSVPHTGTRTLVKRLGATQFYHFGQNDSEIATLGHVHFPIRCPLATSLSWRSYQPDRESCDEFRRWSLAIAFLADHDHTVHVMENYPVLEGQSSPDSWWKKAYSRWELDRLIELPEVEYLLEWITIPSIRSFFWQHYPEGFWWDEMAKLPSLKHSGRKDTSAAGSPPISKDGRLIA
jgi:hypothetical protein